MKRDEDDPLHFSCMGSTGSVSFARVTGSIDATLEPGNLNVRIHENDLMRDERGSTEASTTSGTSCVDGAYLETFQEIELA